jgi:hypothetical protein
MTRLPSPSDHASHDPALIAALAGRPADLDPTEARAARARLEACHACTDLLAELVALSAAIPTSAIPTRPRDFSLTPADAKRLRPAGWRRFIRAIGSARDGVTLPLAMGLTTLGMAGLLVATVPSFSGGSAGSEAVLAPVGSAAPAAPSTEAAQGTDTLAMSADPQPSGDAEGGVFTGGEGEPPASPDDRVGTAALPEDAAIRDDPSGVSVLLVVAGSMLILGLGLFGLRWSARRLGDG